MPKLVCCYTVTLTAWNVWHYNYNTSSPCSFYLEENQKTNKKLWSPNREATIGIGQTVTFYTRYRINVFNSVSSLGLGVGLPNLELLNNISKRISHSGIISAGAQQVHPKRLVSTIKKGDQVVVLLHIAWQHIKQHSNISYSYKRHSERRKGISYRYTNYHHPGAFVICCHLCNSLLWTLQKPWEL